jgi:hypothetical protein
LFAYCENGSINGKDPTGTGPFKAIGIQFSLSIGSIVIGFELLWSLDSGRFYAFFFAGSAASFCPNSMVQSERALMEDMMYIIRKVPKFSISNIQLFKKLSISVSFIAVLGNRYSVFPEDYRGWFTGISLSYYHVQVSGAIGHTGRKIIGSLGIGVTSSFTSIDVSQTFYIQVNGFSSVEERLTSLRATINSHLAWLKFFAFLFA